MRIRGRLRRALSNLQTGRASSRRRFAALLALLPLAVATRRLSLSPKTLVERDGWVLHHDDR